MPDITTSFACTKLQLLSVFLLKAQHASFHTRSIVVKVVKVMRTDSVICKLLALVLLLLSKKINNAKHDCVTSAQHSCVQVLGVVRLQIHVHSA